MEDPTEREAQLDKLCSLADHTRRALYQHVARAGEPVSRDAAAEAVDVDRSVAAYHLDKLVAQGLLTASFARPEGRGGPGAGRPAKHYEASGIEVTASVPPRDYRLIAELLSRALEVGVPDGFREALENAATSVGHEFAADVDEEGLWDLLERHGFQPYRDDGVVRLRNCPFHRLARQHTELVCGMNLAMMTGMVEALGEPDIRPELDPAPERCCVAFHRTDDPG